VNSTAGRLFELEQSFQRTEAELLDTTRRLQRSDAELLEARRRIGELADEIADARNNTKPPAALVEERDRLRARLGEAEQWIGQAQPHIEALRADRERLTAQAVTFTAELQRRTREAEEARSQVAMLRAQLEAVSGRQLALEQERDRLLSGGSVLEATEPLRWGLTAALEHLAAHEAKIPQLSVHLRHLRLLESTLQRLSGAGR
jgi:chromosome segregation ATPase